MLSLALAACLSAAPSSPATYLDTQKRFTLQLPAGWEVAPLPHDMGGMSFHRRRGGALALLGVQVFHFPTAVGLAEFDARVLAAYDQELGFAPQPNSSGATQVAGRPAMRRRFVLQVAPGRKVFKLVEQHTLVVDQTGYAINCEALAESFGAFAGDCRALIDSFRPAQDIDSLPHRHRPAEKLAARHLIGRWQGGSHALRLTPGGEVVLDQLEGTWRIDQGTLVLTFDGQEERLEVEHAPRALTLSGGQFGGEGLLFHALGAPSTP